MSIKTEILTLQHIRLDVSLKIADIERTLEKIRSESEGENSPQLERMEGICDEFRQLYDETTYELQTNEHYTRTYPALCAIGMPDDVGAELLDNEVSTDIVSPSKSGPTESEILNQMEKLKGWGGGYADWSDEKLRQRAIEILEDDIPF